MACETCPFNDGLNEAATQAQNWGCLPDKFAMVDKFDTEGIAFSCHSTPHKACRGLTRVRPTAKQAPVLDYEDWYHGSKPAGQEAAVSE